MSHSSKIVIGSCSQSNLLKSLTTSGPLVLSTSNTFAPVLKQKQQSSSNQQSALTRVTKVQQARVSNTLPQQTSQNNGYPGSSATGQHTSNISPQRRPTTLILNGSNNSAGLSSQQSTLHKSHQSQPVFKQAVQGQSKESFQSSNGLNNSSAARINQNAPKSQRRGRDKRLSMASASINAMINEGKADSKGEVTLEQKREPSIRSGTGGLGYSARDFGKEDLRGNAAEAFNFTEREEEEEEDPSNSKYMMLQPNRSASQLNLGQLKQSNNLLEKISAITLLEDCKDQQQVMSARYHQAVQKSKPIKANAKQGQQILSRQDSAMSLSNKSSNLTTPRFVQKSLQHQSRQPSEGNLQVTKFSELLSPRCTQDLLAFSSKRHYQKKLPVDKQFYSSYNGAEDSEIVIVSVKKSKQSRNSNVNNQKTTAKNQVVFQSENNHHTKKNTMIEGQARTLRIVATPAQQSGLNQKKNISAKRSRADTLRNSDKQIDIRSLQQPSSSLSQRKASATIQFNQNVAIVPGPSPKNRDAQVRVKYLYNSQTKTRVETQDIVQQVKPKQIRQSKSKTPHPKDIGMMIEERNNRDGSEIRNHSQNYQSQQSSNHHLTSHSEMSKMLRLNLQYVVQEQKVMQSTNLLFAKQYAIKEQNSLPNVDQQSLSGGGSCSGGAPHQKQQLNLTSLSCSTQPAVIYKKDDSLLTEEEANKGQIPTVTGNHNLTIDLTLQSSPEKQYVSQQERDLPSLLLGQTMKLENLGIMKFKLQRFVFEYASEFKKMQHEIGQLKKKNADLELELKGYREKESVFVVTTRQDTNGKVEWKV